MTLEEIRFHKDYLVSLAEKNNAYDIRVFGSYARDENTKDIDLDLLIKLKNDADLFDLARLKRELGEYLKMDVDVLPDTCINKHIKDQILAEAKPL